MSDEREQVLAMVAQSKLTPEQAEQLLDVIEARAPQQTRSNPAARPSQPGYAPVAPRAPIPPVPPRAPIPPVPPRAPRAPLSQRKRFDQLIQLAIHEISPEYVKGLRDAGFDDLSVDDVVQLGIHEITPEYIRSLRDAGLTDLTIDQVVQLGIHEVDPETVKRYAEAGLTWEPRSRPDAGCTDDDCADDDCDCNHPKVVKKVRKELMKVGVPSNDDEDDAGKGDE